MWVISFSCPFPLFLAVFCFSSPSPVVQGHMGKMKPNRGEKWNIDFFPPFFVFTKVPMSFSGLFFFTHHSLCSSARRVLTQQSLHTVFFFFFLFDEVSRGPSYSSQGVKCVKWREWVCAFVCFQSRAPADLYLMTKNPEDSPNVQDVLEIEFKKGLWARHMCHLLIPPSVCICLLPVFAVLCKSFKPPIVSLCFYSV